MECRYELFDHTADIGVRVFGATLPELVEPAGQGLYTVIGVLYAGDAAEPLRFEGSGDEPALLLRDYLAELLRLFEMEQQIVTAVRIEEFSHSRLAIAARMCQVDRTRSKYEREVKAITYHELQIRPVSGGYEATYIVDI